MKDFLSTFYGKAIATLTIMALVFGIVAEVITIRTNWLNYRIRRCELVPIADKALAHAWEPFMTYRVYKGGGDELEAILEDCLPASIKKKTASPAPKPAPVAAAPQPNPDPLDEEINNFGKHIRQ